MKHYKSRTGKELEVIAYAIDETSITVRFTNQTEYKYTYASAGQAAVEHMKALAKKNSGLSTYIAQHDPLYENKN